MSIHIYLICTFLISVFLSIILIKFYIYYENKKSTITMIRSEIYSKEKAKTPSSGGFIFVIVPLISTLITNFNIINDKEFISFYLIIFSFFLIGLVDDIKKKKSSKGLSAFIKMFFEILLAVTFLYVNGYNDPDNWRINLIDNNSIYIGSLFVLLFPLLIFGGTNSLNLTDGMDGLLSTLFQFAFLPILLESLLKENYNFSLYFIALYGSLIVYTRYNIHPAKLFMGDSGSLFLGATFMLSSFLMKIEYLLPISGSIFVLETCSVIIQVFSYHVLKKRVFLITPIHHHYSRKGIKEWKIVNVFVLMGFLSLIIAIILLL